MSKVKIVKWILKSLVFGVATIFIFNLIGVYLNMNVPFNIWTIILVGTLKIPGLIMLLILNLL